MIETKKEAEKAVLVFFATKDDNVIKIKESLDELKLLSATAGANVIKTFSQIGESFGSRYMIGKGKVEEIAEYVEEKDVSLVIFENELSFTQLRNLEQKIKCKILDKSNLILDIFANNARSSQAKLQVELAQLEYLLPRLTRQWTHLSKQYGGIGTKGPGETQIETDRRLIKTRISVLKEKLEKIDRQRKTQAIERKNYIRISLVGYTNAGKSTLLNLLTDSDVYVEDKLFATLDTSTRMLKLNNEKVKKIVSRFPKKVLISDTVGFIKNLPHNLIESFKSTLSEVVESDILLHVIDISNPNFEQQIAVVKDTLDEIGAGSRKTINVFNKVDALGDFELLNHLKEENPDSVFMSAKKGLNVEYLLNMVKDELSKEFIKRILRLKKDDYKMLSKIYKLAEVIEVKYLKTFTKVTVNGTKENLDYIEKLIYANIKL
ncbi:MAG: GTPase HflX [Ignavibacteria bacterium]|jgi:GTP-binding protein HflX